MPIRDIAKGGWHPKGKGEGGRESWRSDFKGANTVSKWMGKGKGPSEDAHNHQSAPLSTLKDPASFGPPPKHIGYHGAAAASPSTSTPTDTGGLGAPVTAEGTTAKERLQARRDAQKREEEEANKPPPGPYRVDTTGLNTTNLPKPPQFRPGQATPPPPGGSRAPPPKLPPRLPPRQNSHPDAYSEPPPPTYSESTQDPAPSQGILNQGAMNRLGNAGVSVPGFGIGGRHPSPPVPPRQNRPLADPPVMASPPASPAAAENRGPQLSELQSRFSKMTTSPTQSQPPTQGTTWAEKQAAMKTANNLRNDPSKVSFSDMKNAASTANNFRERHGEQVAAGWNAANNANQKYGIANKANNYTSPTSPATPTSPVPPQSPSQFAGGGIGKKPPPPPPPPKKKELTSSPGEPPPIPLGSKPKF